MYKKRSTLLLIFACFLVLAGCGKANKEVVAASSPLPELSTPSASPTEAPKQAITTQINLFYGNADGDALVTREFSFEQGSNTPYLAILNALTISQEDQSIALFSGFIFQSAVLKDGTLNIDLTLPAEPQLGAPGEELLIESLKKTLFQLSEVKAIEVTVSGKQVESLLGHVDLPHPITQ